MARMQVKRVTGNYRRDSPLWDQVRVGELPGAYQRGGAIRYLPRRFRVNRNTVTSMLRRHGVELGQVGLSMETGTCTSTIHGGVRRPPTSREHRAG